MSKLLLVDDDIELTELLSTLLELEGFDVETANNGLEALQKLNESYKLVLLDVMMPKLNGIETLKEIRKVSNVPVMMLTARGEDIDRVLGLELGADDYLPKPFNDRELIARIKAILRRSTFPSNNTANVEILSFDGITLHFSHGIATYNEENLNLTDYEFKILCLLLKSKGNVVSREELSLEVMEKPLTPFDRSLDMHISNLRRKLPERKNKSSWFKTLRGKGYALVT
ncbi:Alkaline phosphatase synthesis transcriptional regulatory protein PhoP [Haemophilus influenzae]|uniref:response regulator n=1 Tax=Haemophilus influenzae TaxID=727 RepID=UPI000D006DB2|nr:response regulator [Haemophilus influenzae]PRJ58372.1 Alkaline phosphatase synthesis transcriptional regulatory protein PhoP [Haemophilus influenzae]PRJ59169.1 Alkaline phosphatase synthesis transcriptional regulatory protein PhoP [Haemophilus influenzae]PRJ96320.1 Alkaline phosphatase synthesis transcriptional regulatory protein PhoP [Haemophilus influenzae]PRK63260.1 Alkaline phosphatase synthesis transcriptional regulatory protein PhoP [Haemophilus influenzae]PRM09339.1 Alkaline phosphat